MGEDVGKISVVRENQNPLRIEIQSTEKTLPSPLESSSRSAF
jgi:hypothetical protein